MSTRSPGRVGAVPHPVHGIYLGATPDATLRWARLRVALSAGDGLDVGPGQLTVTVTAPCAALWIDAAG